MINTEKRITNTTGYKNIYNCKSIDYFSVVITLNCKKYKLGYFKKLEDAIKVRNEFYKKQEIEVIDE